ncbi:hypothetical protein Tco_0820861 [Tanacetum coccineum]|uniref:Uncharacterized protein n=1 Tax=Tanacetum coccineum TaxID=301880 RepID=A0ABQ5ADL5_9ASTR
MSTLIQDVLVGGFENRPPILENGSYDTYGPFQFKEIVIPGNEKTRRVKEKRLPNGIYTLLNHMKTTNVIWYRVKALMEGTKLTKQGRETKLPDEFEKFTLEKGETIQSYYLRSPKLINGININGIEMKKILINTKFLNLQPKWKRFVTGNVQGRHTRSYGNNGKGKAVELDANKTVGDYVGANEVKDKMLLAKKEKEEGGTLNEEEQNFMAERLELFDLDCEEELKTTSLFMADRVDAFDLDCDEEVTASAIFMAKISPAGSPTDKDHDPSYDPNALSKETKQMNESLTPELERYKF